MTLAVPYTMRCQFIIGRPGTFQYCPRRAQEVYKGLALCAEHAYYLTTKESDKPIPVFTVIGGRLDGLEFTLPPRSHMTGKCRVYMTEIGIVSCWSDDDNPKRIPIKDFPTKISELEVHEDGRAILLEEN